MGRPKHPDILTPREWEVHALLREGRSNEEIANALGVTLATARFHVSEIISKLGVTNRREAAAWQPEPHPRRGAWLAAPVALWYKLKWQTVVAAAGIAGTAIALVLIALLAWGASRSGVPHADAGFACVAPTPTPQTVNGARTEQAREHATFAALTEDEKAGIRPSAAANAGAFVVEFQAHHCDPHALRKSPAGTVELGVFPRTMSEVLARADFVVIGHVTSTTFEPDPDEVIPITHETIAIEETLRGDVGGALTLTHEGGPVPDGRLLSLPGDAVLLPDERVLFFGVHNRSSGEPTSEYPVGKFYIRNGSVYASENNPCNTLDGLPLSEVVDLITNPSTATPAANPLDEACDWSRFE